MYSLFIDSHDINVAIVLFKNGIVLDKIIESSNNKHSTLVMPCIKKIIDRNNLKINLINEIIVVNGPGSFTGERIAVTIAKTMAYCLNVPIKVIDALTVLALCDSSDIKNVSIVDKKGAFIGSFDKNMNIVNDYKYVSKKEYDELDKLNHYVSSIDINYNIIYEYLKDKAAVNVHSVSPLYVKGISALNDKKN